MRAVVLGLIAVAACGDKPAAVDAGVAAPIRRLDLPRLDDPARVVVLANAKPAALVWVDGRGKLAVGKAGPSWRGELTPPQADVLPGDLHLRVLHAIVDGGGARAAAARGEITDLLVQPDPTSARIAAIQRARTIGLLGRRNDPQLPAAGRLPGAPAVPLSKLDRMAPLIMAPASAPASAIVEALRETGGVLAVDHLGQLAVLDGAFARESATGAGTGAWIEASIDGKGVHLTLQPAERESIVPWSGGAIDRAALASGLEELDDRAATLAIDVVVREDTVAQTLIELLSALAAFDHGPLAVASAATADARHELLRRARRGLPAFTNVSPGPIAAQGDLDKARIREVVGDQLTQIQACYDKALLAAPTLGGTVQVQFFIDPAGKVQSASATGVDPGVSKCVAGVFKQLQFPKPVGGGGVQVNYPLRFRSS